MKNVDLQQPATTHELTPRAGIKAKVENEQQYTQYLDELKDIREELGVDVVEELFPKSK